MWLDFAKVSPNKNKGLIHQGYTIGIAINKDGRAMALLQGDEQCVFSVYIGKNKILALSKAKMINLRLNLYPNGQKLI